MAVPTMTSPRKKIKMYERPKTLNEQISNQRLVAKGFLQNKQMGRASKKNWKDDIAYSRDLFALLTVWVNPICLDSKARYI